MMRRIAAFALLLAACDNAAPKVATTEVTLDVATCLEVATGCRGALDEAGVALACFVLEADDGRETRYLRMLWRPGGDPALVPDGEPTVLGAADITARGALFLYRAGSASVPCSAGGLQTGSPCAPGSGCVLKLTQPARRIAPDGTTTFDFRDGGRCTGEWAEAPAERCNDRDDDCDGEVDEGLDLGAACQAGTGACLRDGATACNDAGEVACDATPGAPAEETCNRLDDDCDGEVDEGLECACIPVAEVCNGEDDDCDGEVDEGLLNACGTCGEAPAEQCNNLDDDCDGAIDEGLGLLAVCEEGVGACRAAGVVVCAPDGSTRCQVEPGAPSPEACNGTDDDCNGVVDDVEGLGAPCSAGIGECAQDGEMVCDLAARELRCSAEQAVEALEICDGADNDCNGRIDDVRGLRDPCMAGVGACRREGRLACDIDARMLVCDATPGMPAAEICDNVDNNCDGQVDNVPGLGERCTAGIGACQRAGERVCDVLERRLQCNAVAGPPGAERCNDLDDDCDGRVDEGLGLGDPCTEGVGVCERAGTVICGQGGATTCTAVAGPPGVPTCDGRDNDCDGDADECARLVINEVDYDQPGADTMEFVEIYNAGETPADLDGTLVEIVDANGQVTDRFVLGLGVLAPGEFLVAGQQALLDQVPPGPRTVLLPGPLPSTPGGLRLFSSQEPPVVADRMSWASVIQGLTEGNGAAPADRVGGDRIESIYRCPDGRDTNHNGQDFHRGSPTPGRPNACN